jgi:hypothetical protein
LPLNELIKVSLSVWLKAGNVAMLSAAS